MTSIHEIEERALLVDFQGGDRVAFEKIFRLHHASLILLIYKKNMKYAFLKIMLMASILFTGCEFGKEKQYFLEFTEEQKIVSMPSDIYLGDQKIGTVDQVLLKSSVPTFKVTLSDPIPMNSTVELTQIDMLGSQKLLLKKSNSKNAYQQNDTIIGFLKYIKPKNIYPKLRDSIIKSIREGKGILQFDIE